MLYLFILKRHKFNNDFVKHEYGSHAAKAMAITGKRL